MAVWPGTNGQVVTTAAVGYTFVPVTGVYQIQVYFWSGGGSGGASGSTNNRGGGGAGGGNFVENIAMSVSPGTTYNVDVGSGSPAQGNTSAGANGNFSGFYLGGTTMIQGQGGNGGGIGPAGGGGATASSSSGSPGATAEHNGAAGGQGGTTAGVGGGGGGGAGDTGSGSVGATGNLTGAGGGGGSGTLDPGGPGGPGASGGGGGGGTQPGGGGAGGGRTTTGNKGGGKGGDGAGCIAWTVPTTVTFNNNGGAGSIASEVSNISMALTANGGAMSKSDFFFNGWNAGSTGGTFYADGAAYNFPVSGSTTMFANWAQFTVTFNANGGSGSSSESHYSTTTLNTFSGMGITYGARIFQGWNTAANGSGTAYANQANYNFTSGNATLYAQWLDTLSIMGVG